MKINAKLLAVLAVLMMVAMLFVSCDTASVSNDTTTLGDEVTTGAPEGEEGLFMDPENVQIFADGEGNKKTINFTVVRPESAGSDSVVVNAAQVVRENIAK